MAPFALNAPGTIGLGGMRLSTDPDRDEDRAIAVLHAAFDAGIGFLDTADAYCLDDSETGHNERLIARAIATWQGDGSTIRVATKGGLTRPHGAWVEDGRAKHLRAACEASRRALAVERIHLYQLHAPDPRTPLATSVRALQALQQDGFVERIGLCNVSLAQLEESRRHAEITSVQIELGVWTAGNILSGVVPYCVAHGIQVLAHRPLGGPARRARMGADPVLREIAARHGATAPEIALAWLMALSPLIVPLPGATRPGTVQSIARAAAIVLTDRDRDALDARFPEGRRLRGGASPSPSPGRRIDGEVVLVMGLPAAGKSTLAQQRFAGRGYARLNRDEAGGTLGGLVPALDRTLASGTTRVVLDNTYLTRKSRAAVIDTASGHDLPVRCVWLTTSVEDAQVNAVWRMLEAHGRLLDPEDIRAMARRDPAVFGPSAQFRAQRTLEPAAVAEGFTAVEEVPFVRERDTTRVHRAVIVWCDGVLLDRGVDPGGTENPEAAVTDEVLATRADRLTRCENEGWRVLGLSWQPRIADGTMTPADVERRFARMRERLGVSIAVEYCPHAAGPPVCWCRKPLPGLGAVLITKYQLDPAACLYVGSGPQDRGFARRLGFRYADAVEFFGGG